MAPVGMPYSRKRAALTRMWRVCSALEEEQRQLALAAPPAPRRAAQLAEWLDERRAALAAQQRLGESKQLVGARRMGGRHLATPPGKRQKHARAAHARRRPCSPPTHLPARPPACPPMHLRHCSRRSRSCAPQRWRPTWRRRSSTLVRAARAAAKAAAGPQVVPQPDWVPGPGGCRKTGPSRPREARQRLRTVQRWRRGGALRRQRTQRQRRRQRRGRSTRHRTLGL